MTHDPHLAGSLLDFSLGSILWHSVNVSYFELKLKFHWKFTRAEVLMVFFRSSYNQNHWATMILQVRIFHLIFREFFHASGQNSGWI